MKNQIITFALSVIALTFANMASAQSSSSSSGVYMNINGDGGRILGEMTQQGFQGFHRIQAYSHEIVSPRDAASGLPTGKRQHMPFRIVKLHNRGTPDLLTAMTKNTVLPSIEVSIWSPTPAGSEQKVLTYRLNNASVASIRPWMPNIGDPNTRDYAPAEEVSFTYESIQVTFHNGDITAEDKWNQSGAAAASVAR